MTGLVNSKDAGLVPVWEREGLLLVRSVCSPPTTSLQSGDVLESSNIQMKKLALDRES